MYVNSLGVLARTTTELLFQERIAIGILLHLVAWGAIAVFCWGWMSGANARWPKLVRLVLALGTILSIYGLLESPYATDFLVITGILSDKDVDAAEVTVIGAICIVVASMVAIIPSRRRER